MKSRLKFYTAEVYSSTVSFKKLTSFPKESANSIVQYFSFETAKFYQKKSDFYLTFYFQREKYLNLKSWTNDEEEVVYIYI